MRKSERIVMTAVVVIIFIGSFYLTQDFAISLVLTISIGITCWVLYLAIEEGSETFKK